MGLVELSASDWGLLSWLLKDAGWTLLCAQLSFPAALAALCLEGYCLVWQARGSQAWAQRAQEVLTFMWLAGNATWMASELLFSPLSPSGEAGRRFPWYHGPLAGANEDAYLWGVCLSRLIFISGLAGLLICYAACGLRYARGVSSVVELAAEAVPIKDKPSRPRPTPVCGLIDPEVYKTAFIGPWVLKDVFWTFELVWPALLCALVVVLLMGDCLRRFGGVEYTTELLWVSGNAVWISAELLCADAHRSLRIVTCSLLAAGCVCLLSDRLGGGVVWQKSKEDAPLQDPVVAAGGGAAPGYGSS